MHCWRARHQREVEQSFVQDAAHELKTPLAAVAAQAHVLATAQGQEQRRAALKVLELGVQRASHQVNQLLTLAALESAPPDPARLVDLVDIASEVLIELEPLAGRRGTELTLQAPDRLMDRVDVDALRSVLVNLVRNAIQHGAEDGTVEVSLERDQDMVSLRVGDDGPGIPVAERERVFDRFYRAASTPATGSGLGLAIVVRAARRLNASVQIAEGPQGRGVALVVRWRMAQTA
jgi:signal transduction histidine kinase